MQPPSSVNNCARQAMADHRYQWQDAEWLTWGDTPSRASATTFKIATDVTARYLADRRMKFANGSSTLYGTIISSSYSAPDTTITVSLDNDTSLTASLSQVALAILSPTNTSIPANNLKNKNLIIGGNFDTNPWQRGTSFASATSGYYADRFIWGQTGAGAVSIIKTADAPTLAQCGMVVTNCMHADVTTADASPLAAGDIYYFHQYIEGYNWAQIAQRPFTLSFWVKSTKTGIFCVAFVNSGGDRSYVAEYTINASDTWEKKTITVSASPSAGTWSYTTGIGLDVAFTVAAGSNFHTTANAWQTNSTAYLATANQVNGMDSTSNNFKLALIQVEPGSNATPFEIRTIGEELALCQRYYQKTFALSTAPAQNVGTAVGALQYYASTAGVSKAAAFWQFTVPMRVAPTTVTRYSPGAASTDWYNVDDAAASGAATVAMISERGIYVENAQAAGDGVGERIALHLTAYAEL